MVLAAPRRRCSYALRDIQIGDGVVPKSLRHRRRGQLVRTAGTMSVVRGTILAKPMPRAGCNRWALQ